jgi:hypothetical protein
MIQLILRKQFKKSAKGIDPLLEYNCLCLQVNPTVGCRTGREVNHPMIKTHMKKKFNASGVCKYKPHHLYIPTLELT